MLIKDLEVKSDVFTEEIKKITLSANDDNKIQSIDSIESCAYETSKNVVYKKEEIKCNNIKNNAEMISFDDVAKENIKELNRNLPQIPNHLHRILIIGGFGYGKTNVLLNLIKKQDDGYIDKIYLYVRELNEPKHQYLIKKPEKMVLKIQKI